MDLPMLPQDLSAWAYVAISLIVVIGLVAIAYFTGNHKKKSTTFKNISQSGNNNKQRIGNNTDNKKEGN